MEILEKRRKIYGEFSDIAKISQDIKEMYYLGREHNDYTINEAFDMIAHKLARIINGGWFYIDNWRDIAGYAQLITEYLENNENAIDSKIIYLEKDENNNWREKND